MKKRKGACSIARIVMAFACVGLLAGAPSVQATGSGAGTAHFSGVVWIDSNGNGIKEPGEPVVPGVKVVPQLETYANNFEEKPNYTITTDNNGYYAITLPESGRWRLRFYNPNSAVYVPTIYRYAGSDTATDNDVKEMTQDDKSGLTDVYPFDGVSSTTGTVYTNVNAGFVANTFTVSGIAFLEMDEINHYYEEGRDLLLKNVTVTLCDESYVVMSNYSSVKTDDSGRFEIKGLEKNRQYRLRYDLPPNSSLTYVVPNYSRTNPSINPKYDSKAVADSAMPSRGYSEPFNVGNGDINTLSVGCYANNYITGYVWEDQNQDGRRDSSEPVIQGLEVQVMNADGSVYVDNSSGVVVVRTSTSGRYTVAGLAPGSYKLIVRKRASADVFTTKQKSGVEDALSSKVDANGFTDVITVYSVTGSMAPQRIENVNAGLYVPNATPTPWYVTPTPTPWYYTPTPSPQYYYTPTPSPQYYYTPTPSPSPVPVTATPEYTDGNFENMSKTGESIVPLILSLGGGLAVVYAAFLILHKRKRPKV